MKGGNFKMDSDNPEVQDAMAEFTARIAGTFFRGDQNIITMQVAHVPLEIGFVNVSKIRVATDAGREQGKWR
jgi:hypothetical protein